VEHTGSRSHPDNSRFFLRGCRKGNPFYRCFRKALISFFTRGPMDDDDEIDPHVTNGRSHFDMDEAFCARMRAAIEAGLENAPIGVITTPGTKKPKYIRPEQWPLRSSLGAMDF
jgi:hypothetical protein